MIILDRYEICSEPEFRNRYQSVESRSRAKQAGRHDSPLSRNADVGGQSNLPSRIRRESAMKGPWMHRSEEQKVKKANNVQCAEY